MYSESNRITLELGGLVIYILEKTKLGYNKLRLINHLER